MKGCSGTRLSGIWKWKRGCPAKPIFDFTSKGRAAEANVPGKACVAAGARGRGLRVREKLSDGGDSQGKTGQNEIGWGAGLCFFFCAVLFFVLFTEFDCWQQR